MIVKNKMTFVQFDATDGNGGWSYPTQAEAKAQITSMSKGFPENNFMTDENRAYWKRASKRYYVTKVTKITERV